MHEMIYSTHPVEHYYLPLEHDLARRVYRDFGAAGWNLVWLSNPTYDHAPFGKNWASYYEALEPDVVSSLLGDLENGLKHVLSAHPNRFLHWLANADHTAYWCFDIPGWVETVRPRALQAAERLTSQAQPVAPREGNVYFFAAYRGGRK